MSINKKILIVYILLAFFKLFTGVVVEIGDPTTSFVLKAQPTIVNYWSLGEENQFNKAKHKGSWYNEGRYLTIVSGENGFSGESLYWFIIRLWWFTTTILVGVTLLKQVKRVGHNIL